MTVVKLQGPGVLFNRAGLRRAAVVAATILSSVFMTACRNQGRADQAPAEELPPQDSASLCLHGCPTGAAPANRVVARPIYILSNNGTTKFADWVAYEVTAKTIGPTEKRVWHKDPELPDDETLAPADYKNAAQVLHMDRGHQAPLASLTGTPYWDMADDLSNITPQSKALNEGPWERLEQAERNLALSDTMLVVYAMTGPLYERDMPQLPNARLSHKIPSGYWKIVAVEKNGVIETAAYIMDQSLPRDADFTRQRTTIRMVEKRSRLDFFPKLTRAQQDKIETVPGTLEKKLAPVKPHAASPRKRSHGG